uniref:Uncharacterized protein n=1 Tax=Entomoneis paludosa TaxID=265537 RepID=A0A7S2Y6K5_9STRA
MAPYQTLVCFPMVTSPITEAEGATKHSSETFGTTSSKATKRVEGTNFSEYFVTSIPFPALSKATPTTRNMLAILLAVLATRDDMMILNLYTTRSKG